REHFLGPPERSRQVDLAIEADFLELLPDELPSLDPLLVLEIDDFFREELLFQSLPIRVLNGGQEPPVDDEALRADVALRIASKRSELFCCLAPQIPRKLTGDNPHELLFCPVFVAGCSDLCRELDEPFRRVVPQSRILEKRPDLINGSWVPGGDEAPESCAS